MNMPLIKKERRPWWISPWGDEALGDVWSDRLFPVWQRMKGEEWVPTFNFYEEDGNYKLEAEIPGVNKEDISVTIDKNVLTVSGKKESKVEEKKANYYLKESSYGSFSRSLRLPGEVDEGKSAGQFSKRGTETDHAPEKDDRNQADKNRGLTDHYGKTADRLLQQRAFFQSSGGRPSAGAGTRSPAGSKPGRSGYSPRGDHSRPGTGPGLERTSGCNPVP